jgi:glycosyltransferase involved in cell wall biosynthesis
LLGNSARAIGQDYFMMRPLVSILIPAHNAESLIADTIKSALGQTWPRKEIIIVDDGSTDQTVSVAQQFASKEVLVVGQPNLGASAARNKAYTLSQGDHIQWLDADDLLSPDKVARQVEAGDAACSKRTLLTSAWGSFMFRPYKAVFSPTTLWCDMLPIEYMLRKMEQNVYMQTTSWLVSRELSEAAGPWDVRLWKDNDGEYLCRVLMACDGIRFVPDAKSFYRRSGINAISHMDRSSKKLESQFLSVKLHIEYLCSMEDSEQTRKACLECLQRWVVTFYPERLDIFSEMGKLAETLGGRLTVPRLSWKYAWIQKMFGWSRAKRAQLFYNETKTRLRMAWDKTLFRLENRDPADYWNGETVSIKPDARKKSKSS